MEEKTEMTKPLWTALKRFQMRHKKTHIVYTKKFHKDESFSSTGYA